MSRQYKRRHYFIDHAFQGKFIVSFLILSVLASVIAVLLFNVLAYRKMDRILYSMTMPASAASDLLFPEIALANALSLLFIAAVFIMTARRLFARIKFPLQRIHVELAKIGEGNVRTRIHLRERDEFKGFADRLNEMTAALAERIDAIDHDVQRISETLSSLKQEDTNADAGPVIKRLQHEVAALKMKLKAARK